MITVKETERIAEMAKIELKGEELLKVQKELCRMAQFARQISEAAEAIDESDEKIMENIREDRLHCPIESTELSSGGMHMKDGFFRMKAGDRK